jgi:hypothetical protein
MFYRHIIEHVCFQQRDP